MITLTSFVSRPSLAPTVSTAQGSGLFRVAHRRVNQLGQFTALSPLALDRAFPMTITPQAYQDSDSLLRDEILISDDAGTTWHRAYSGLISAPVAISAWSNSWPVVSIGDTQTPGLALDAGRFNPGSAPSFDIYLLTESSTFSTVSLRLWDTITGSQASMFAGLVQLVYRGQIASGTGALTSSSGVTIWQGSEASTASIPVAGFASQVHKFELTFLGYPPSLPALSLGFELSINRTVYSIDLADDWAEGSLWLNPDKQFLWPPLKPTSTGGNVTIERFIIAGSGVALLNSGQITRTLANGTHWLSVSPTGKVSLETTVPAGNYTIAKAIVSGDVLTRVFPACTFRAQRLAGPAGAGLVPYRFINFSNGLLVPSAGTTGSTVRVSTNSTGAHVTSGFALVEAGEAISVGSNIKANSNGKAINESGIGLGVALSEAYADGDLILVQLITASEGGGAITPNEVRDALAGLTGANRLDASAIKNLPSSLTNIQIRDSLQTLTGADRLNASAIFGITSALEALTGTDRLDASAIKNLPDPPTGMQIRLALETLSGNFRLDASAIKNLPSVPTGIQIRGELETLTGADRLDASAIKNLPSVPTALSQLTNDTNFTTLAGVASVGYLTVVPDNSVSTPKVQDGAITNAKLASGIDASKITAGTISSARLDTGTSANKIVQLDSLGRLPALDGSQLTNLPSGGGGGASITVQDEGSTLTSALTAINFTGAGVTATNTGGNVTVNIPNTGGGSGGFNTVSPTSNNFPAMANDLILANSFSIALPSTPQENDIIYFLVLENPCLVMAASPTTLNLQLSVSSFKINQQGFIIPLLFKNSRWNISPSYVSDIALDTVNLTNYQSPGDSNGIIYYLGTVAINSITYVNPVPTQVVATSSGVHQPGVTFGVDKVTDRNLSTGWHASSDIAPQSQIFQLDFQSRGVDITRIVIRPWGRTDGLPAVSPTIVEKSNDGLNWTALHSFTSQVFSGQNLVSPELSASGAFSRYIRFRRTNNTDWWQQALGEIELYGFLSP